MVAAPSWVGKGTARCMRKAPFRALLPCAPRMVQTPARVQATTTEVNMACNVVSVTVGEPEAADAVLTMAPAGRVQVDRDDACRDIAFVNLRTAGGELWRLFLPRAGTATRWLPTGEYDVSWTGGAGHLRVAPGSGNRLLLSK